MSALQIVALVALAFFAGVDVGATRTIRTFRANRAAARKITEAQR